MKCLALFVLVLGMLSGCANSTGDVDPTIASVERFVGKRLKDPTTAIYSDIRVHPDPAFFVACGEVNAKNSFGAYEGNTFFVKYTGLGVRFAQPDDRASLRECCDVLMAYDTGAKGDVEEAPGFERTCGRLDFFSTLR